MMSKHKQFWFIAALIPLLLLAACGQDESRRGNGNGLPDGNIADGGNNRGNSADAPGHNKTPGVPPGQANRPAATAVVIPEAPARTDNPLKDRFTAVQPADDGSVAIIITDDEFNQAIQMALSQSSQPSPIENPQVTFTGGNVILTGSVTTPVSGQLTVLFRPYVAAGLLQFEVVSATLGDVRVPAPLLTSAQNTLNTTLNDAMSNMPGNITLQDVIMGEGTMTIVGSASL